MTPLSGALRPHVKGAVRSPFRATEPGTPPSPPDLGDNFLLESGLGSWALEDDSGNWLLESA